MYTKADIQQLLDQYITGSLSEEGRETLHGILRNPAYEPLLAELLDGALSDRLAAGYQFPETEQRIKAGLLQSISEQEVPGTRAAIIEDPLSVYRPKHGKTWRPWLAAAVTAGIVIAAWQWSGKQAVKQPAAATTTTAAAPVPGSNKAVLVLADGSMVPLDSLGSQQLVQGHATIQQQNGSLQYTAQGQHGEVAFNTLRTPRGGQFQVTLGDGTKVWLNSASSLRYPTVFNGSERVVELSGQGYFEIAPNAAQPFKVNINGATAVQVLGTSFDVMAYADEAAVKTTLLQGAVRVVHGAATTVLQPGQQATARSGNTQIAVNEVDVTKVTDWKNGLFIFNNTELPAILREVARWYDVEIVYEAPASKNRFGGGLSRKMALADVLRFLEEGGANHFKIEGKKVIVLP